MSNKKLKEEILKEEIRKNNKRVRDRNYRFRKLSPAKKRVSIARDVIKQLNTEKFTAQTGTYFELDLKEDIVKEDLSFIISKSESCNVCALGALFSSCVLKNNHFKLDLKQMFYDSSEDNIYVDVWRSEIEKYLKSYFSIEQLSMIEIAFEEFASNINIKNIKESDTRMKCEHFGKMFLDDRDRMIAIMKNIIDNNGKFVP